MIAGNEIYFITQGDKEHVSFMQRVMRQPEENVAKSLEAGLSNMKADPSIVLHVSDGMLKSAFREDPFLNQPLKTFARGRYEFYNFILFKNSPISPAFRHGLRKMMQTGVTNHLMGKWLGTSIPTYNTLDKQV